MITKTVTTGCGLFGAKSKTLRKVSTSRSRLDKKPNRQTARTGCGLFGFGGRPILTATRTRPSASFKPASPPAFRTDLGPDLLPFIIRGRACPFEEFSGSELRRNPIRIERGAFRNELRKIRMGRSNCSLKCDHRPGSWLASTDSGTLQVYESHDGPESMTGLCFAARLPAAGWAREIALEIRNGGVGVSLGLGLRETSDTILGEVVLRSRLLEISLVRNPVYRSTWTTLEPLTADQDLIMRSLYFGD